MFGFAAFTDQTESGSQGHGEAATRVSVESALHAAGDLDAGDIIVRALDSCVILEGFVRRCGDIDRAVEVAENIVGQGHVRSRLLRR